jgi:hypothetical protein
MKMKWFFFCLKCYGKSPTTTVSLSNSWDLIYFVAVHFPLQITKKSSEVLSQYKFESSIEAVRAMFSFQSPSFTVRSLL